MNVPIIPRLRKKKNCNVEEKLCIHKICENKTKKSSGSLEELKGTLDFGGQGDSSTRINQDLVD